MWSDMCFLCHRFSGFLQVALLWGGGSAAQHSSATLQLCLCPAGRNHWGSKLCLPTSPPPSSPLPSLSGPWPRSQWPDLLPKLRLHQLLLWVMLPNFPLQHLLLCPGDRRDIWQQPHLHTKWSRGRLCCHAKAWGWLHTNSFPATSTPSSTRCNSGSHARRRTCTKTVVLWQRRSFPFSSTTLSSFTFSALTPFSPSTVSPHPPTFPSSRPSPPPPNVRSSWSCGCSERERRGGLSLLSDPQAQSLYP